MKKFNLSLVAVLAMSTFAIAGGDIAPVEPVVETPYVEESTGSLYLGLGYSLFNSDSDFAHISNNTLTLGHDDDYSAIMMQAGYKFNDYVALEGRYWVGLTDGSWSGIAADTFESDVSAWGVYVKPMYPITDALDIYALLGYASVDVGHNNTLPDMDFDGFSWGIGAAYSFTENFAIFADYTDFQDDDFIVTNNSNININGTFEHAFDSINFGVTYQF